MMQTQQLHLQDSPPLSIPFSFFLTAPISIAAAGMILLISGDAAFTSRWAPMTLSLTHLGTLGFLTMVMFGALYQMLAVVVGSPVPRLRLAHAVHILLTIGVASLCWGFARLGHASGPLSLPWIGTAIFCLGLATLLFLFPIGIALMRVENMNQTSFGIRSAMLCFLLTACLGLWMAYDFATLQFSRPRDIWSQVHLGVALLGWVGSLIAAISWQVIPMFYLARPQLPSMIKWGVQILAVLGAVGPILLLAFASLWEGLFAADALSRYAAWALSPAILSIWCIHPVASFWSLQGRRSRRSDGSLLFWKTGLLLAPLTAFGALAAFMAASPNWDLAFGWLAIWGWAGMIMHGMLTRIAPFLVWLHRFAPLVGHIPVPSVRKILPNPWIRIGYSLHLGSLIAGLLALATGWQPLTRLTGLGLMATAAWMGVMFIRVLSQKAAEASEAG